MRICITGGLGLVGLPLVRALNNSNNSLLVIDKMKIPPKVLAQFKNVKFLTVDIDSILANEELVKFKADTVVHLAAQKDVVTSLSKPIYDAEENVMKSLRLFESAVDSGTKNFIFASSGGAIYSRFAKSPYSEDSLIKPESPYGVSKLAFELYLESAAKLKGIRFVNMRLSNVYGSGDSSAGVIPKFVSKALKGEPVTVFGDGNSTRDYISTRDIAPAFLSAIHSSFSGNVNIGSGIGTSLFDLIRILEDLLSVQIRIEHAPWRDGEILNSVLNCELARKSLHWKTETSLSDGIFFCLQDWRLSFENRI
jgi:UDP-glucose 4-epimerase